jgi:hypothetical protein
VSRALAWIGALIAAVGGGLASRRPVGLSALFQGGEPVRREPTDVTARAA